MTVFLILGLVSLTADMTYEEGQVGERGVPGEPRGHVHRKGLRDRRGRGEGRLIVRPGLQAHAQPAVHIHLHHQDFVSENGNLEGGMEAVAEDVTGR